MKIGICFGTYAPLHQGHLDVIMRAKKENDRCLVFVSGDDNDRGSLCGLPLRKRYRLVKKFFEDDETVDVFNINCTALGLDDSWSNNNRSIRITNVYEKIKHQAIYGDFTWYVSEKSYKDSIDNAIKWFPTNNLVKNNPTILMNRSENLISGTECRENPVKNWDKIAYTFHGHFSHNVLVLGTASEGKTTLVKDIAKYFGLVYSEEYGRLAMEKTLKIDGDLTCKDFVDFLNGQYLLNRSKIDSKENKGVFISDTDNLVTLMYAKRYTTIKDIDDDPNHVFPVTAEEYTDILKPLAEVLQRGIKWDKIFFLTPNNEFFDDGTRYMLQSSMDERKINEKILRELLEEFNLMDKVEFLQGGSYYENFCKVKEYIESVFNY